MRKLIIFLVYFAVGISVVVDVHKRTDTPLPDDGALIAMILLWPVFPITAAIAYIFPHEKP